MRRNRAAKERRKRAPQSSREGSARAHTSARREPREGAAEVRLQQPQADRRLPSEARVERRERRRRRGAGAQPGCIERRPDAERVFRRPCRARGACSHTAGRACASSNRTSRFKSETASTGVRGGGSTRGAGLTNTWRRSGAGAVSSVSRGTVPAQEPAHLAGPPGPAPFTPSMRPVYNPPKLTPGAMTSI